MSLEKNVDEEDGVGISSGRHSGGAYFKLIQLIEYQHYKSVQYKPAICVSMLDCTDIYHNPPALFSLHH